MEKRVLAAVEALWQTRIFAPVTAAGPIHMGLDFTSPIKSIQRLQVFHAPFDLVEIRASDTKFSYGGNDCD